MKKIDKSALMRRAWQIYKTGGAMKDMFIPTILGEMKRVLCYDKNFSECLKRAWEIEKKNAEEAQRSINPVVISQEAYDNFYSAARYFGD